MVEDNVLFTNHLAGKKGILAEGHVGCCHSALGWTWFKLAVTSSNWFLPVVAHDK